jgi:hypothetical protein
VALTFSEVTPAGTAKAINPGVVSTNVSALATGAIAADATTDRRVASKARIDPVWPIGVE